MIYSTVKAIAELSKNPKARFSLVEGGFKYILCLGDFNVIKCRREDLKGGRPIFIDDEWLKEDEKKWETMLRKE